MSEQIQKKVTTPLTADAIADLKTGDKVLISGVIYTARDAAHKKLMGLLDEGKDLPFELKGNIIYYVGPTPAREGEVIGSAGPTTSGRMDAYTPRLLDLGLTGIIGKGQRNKEVKDALVKNKSIYFAAVGGAAALIKRSIKSSEVIAYEELGPEAIRKLVVEDFPAIVANDTYGGDLFSEGIEKYRKD